TGTVDTMNVGSYIISYDVTDSAGNVAFTVTRTVTVTPDTTKPVMTLVGNAHDTITVFSSYTDLGATATDLVDGNLDASVSVLSNNLDSSKVGTYTITYTVSDLSGNIAFISRLVTVVDTVQPTILLTGNNPLIWLVKVPYVDPGHTVIDNYDTGLVATITGTVNYNVPGTYQLFFNVVDNSGDSAATVIRTVIVADTVKPLVDLVGPDTITMDVFTSYFEFGATATDNYDVTLPAVSVLGAVDTALVADQVLKYIVTDSSGNTSDTAIRIVKVVDRVAPVIIVHDPIVIQRTQPKPTLADSVDYSDNYYPKQQLTLNITENIDVNVEGYYTVEYTVSDPSGNVSQVAKGFVIVTRAVGILPPVINDNAVSVYPNPASDKAYVSMNFIRETNATVTVYSITGQKVLEAAPQGSFTEKTVELDLTSLSAGQYFVRIEGADGVVTKKLVITNR
ncbi:MAG TPA: immunoglobulin-like domain-containing protein, partial [Bacteroidia bacterium]|nr:immunoglobulin-like domain-containing protein [Bacteroidia bacterium]